jgi:uncharacterized protein YjiK
VKTALPLALLGFAACGGTAAPQDDFADGVLVLPAELREVSAIALADEHTLVCLQDEVGALFFVDLDGRVPVRAAAFDEPGDYEGLARVGDAYWVLRSDGVLLRLGRERDALRVVSNHRLPEAHREWEALCFDADRRRLLVMPKDAGGSSKDRDARYVYAVDPDTGAVEDAPVLVLSLRTVVEQAAARGIALPSRTSDKGRTRTDVRFAVSELLVVPGSGRLLVLAAGDRTVFEFDRDGTLTGAWMLDPDELPQPEGMAMLADGRLLVASERTGSVRAVRLR